ncbi:unnamed protein product, partial [Ectocarpus sp. 12 AP-2014]
ATSRDRTKSISTRTGQASPSFEFGHVGPNFFLMVGRKRGFYQRNGVAEEQHKHVLIEPVKTLSRIAAPATVPAAFTGRRRRTNGEKSAKRGPNNERTAGVPRNGEAQQASGSPNNAHRAVTEEDKPSGQSSTRKKTRRVVFDDHDGWRKRTFTSCSTTSF